MAFVLIFSCGAQGFAAQQTDNDVCKDMHSAECRQRALTVVQDKFRAVQPKMQVSATGDTIIFADPKIFKKEEARKALWNATAGQGFEIQLCNFGFRKMRLGTLAGNTVVDTTEYLLNCPAISPESPVPSGVGLSQAADPNPFVIKGHALGESIADFLVKEPKVQADVAECRRDKKPPAWTLSGNCNQLLALAAGGSMVVPPTGVLSERLDNAPHYAFSSGILIWVRFSYLVGDDNPDQYEKLKNGLAASYGPPRKETSSQYENAYGASYTGYQSLWLLENAAIQLQLFPGPEPYCVIIATMRSEFDRQAEGEKAKKAINPLK